MKDLAINLGANTASFEASMKRAAQSVTGIEKAISTIKISSFTYLASEAYNAAQRIFQFGKEVATMANDIERLSRVVGMSTDEYQKWTFAANMADVSVESLSTGFKFLSRNMAEAASTGKGDAAEAFAAMGISVKDTSGNLKTLDKAMLEIMDKFAGWADGPEKIALALKLFGRSGEELIPYLNKGSAGFREFAEQAKKFGIIIDPTVIEAGSKAEDIFKRLDAQFKSLKINMAPTILKIAEFADELMKLSNKMDEWGKPISKLIDLIERFGKTKIQRPEGLSLWEQFMWGFKSRQEKLRETLPVYEVPPPENLPKPKSPMAGPMAVTYDKDWIREWVEGSRELQAMTDRITVAMYDATKQSDSMRESFSMTDEEIKKDTATLREFEYALYIKGAKEAELRYGLQETAGLTDKLVENAKEASKTLDDIGKEFGSILTSNMVMMMSTTDSWAEKFKRAGESILQTILQIIAKQIIMNALFEDAGKGEGFLGKESGIGKTFGGIGSSVVKLVGGIGGLFGLQHGGIISRPTPAMVGEGGPEAVIPLKGGKVPIEGGKKTGDTYITYIEATDVESFAKRYGNVIEGIYFRGKRFNKMSMR